MVRISPLYVPHNFPMNTNVIFAIVLIEKKKRIFLFYFIDHKVGYKYENYGGESFLLDLVGKHCKPAVILT